MWSCSDSFDHHLSGPEAVSQSSSSPRSLFTPRLSQPQHRQRGGRVARHLPRRGEVSCQGPHEQKLIQTWGERVCRRPLSKAAMRTTRPPSKHQQSHPDSSPHPRNVLLSFGLGHSRDSQLTFEISLNSWLICFYFSNSNLWKYILKNQTKCTLLIDGPFSVISQSKWAFVPSGMLSHDWTPIKGFKNTY